MSSELRGRLLVVDDSADTTEVLNRQLTARGLEVLTARDVAQAVRLLEREPIDLVITDLKMPGASGLELVRHVREHLPRTQVIMITGYPSIETAVQAVKLGAEEYLPKPFTQEELLAAVGQALARVERQGTTPRPAAAPPNPLGLVADCESMRRVLAAVAAAARGMDAVLISGESGTGKELLARAIHHAGPRADAPLLIVDCGLPEPVIARQLFGAPAAANAGAAVLAARLREAAPGGTLLLRECPDLPVGVQEMLLLALEALDRSAGGRDVPPGPRLLATSDRDLRALTDAGSFRPELNRKLGAQTIEVPPLRERGEDIVALAQRFLLRFARERGVVAPRLSDAAVALLKSYPWPGNIAEMRNRIQQLVAEAAGDVIRPLDLPASLRAAAGGDTDPTSSLAEVERAHVRTVLASVGGNKTKAAKILGINRKTLRDKLAQFGDN